MLAILILMSVGQLCESARILAIMPTPSYSHQIVFNPLWKALNSRGHDITLLTTNPIKIQSNSTNFHQINWNFAYKLWHEKHNIAEMIKNFNTNTLKSFVQYADMLDDITIQELEHPEIQKLLNNEQEHFDLVIVEIIHPAMIMFSHKYNCPFIGISPLDITSFSHEMLGNPTSPALYPDFITPFDAQMNFFERIASVFYYIGTKVYFKYYLYPRLDTTVRKYFGDEVPKLEDLQRNASMVFLNINPVVHDIRPLMPNVLMIGGSAHFQNGHTLPTDIQKFLDDAGEAGAIYFSMGTNVNSQTLPSESKSVFLQAFLELPYKVIWKLDEDLNFTHPNLLVKPWMPQQDILRHPNIKLFITQGGLQSLEEAIYNGVPIIGMPAFLDQVSNIRRMVRKGIGLKLNYYSVTAEEFKDTITEVITNEKYRNRAKEMSKLLTDQPISGLDQAVWWTEYVIKHKGTRYLKHTDIPLYQYFMLDVMALFLAISVITIYMQYKLFNLFVKNMRKRRRNRKTVKFD